MQYTTFTEQAMQEMAQQDININIDPVKIAQTVVGAIPFALGITIGTVWWGVRFSVATFKVGFRMVNN